ncbi:hypothetical protein [Paraburkholderia phytofirmans]|uniref:hypothetical protein n=1 Tax=Paraburkholderia phytofirmans TaxID=261302 RepID=UPI0038BDE9D9
MDRVSGEVFRMRCRDRPLQEETEYDGLLPILPFSKLIVATAHLRISSQCVASRAALSGWRLMKACGAAAGSAAGGVDCV